MWRGSSHFHLETGGTGPSGAFLPQLCTFQINCSSELMVDSGCTTTGLPRASQASKNARGTPLKVSPLMPSAPTALTISASPSQCVTPGSRVPWSHGLAGRNTLTPRFWKACTAAFNPARPPGMSCARSNWLRSSMPMFG
ncbi:hypothetical protein D3C71_1264550 [compost metagenome]